MVDNRDEPPEDRRFTISKSFEFDWDIWLSNLFGRKKRDQNPIHNEPDVGVLETIHPGADEQDRAGTG